MSRRRVVDTSEEAEGIYETFMDRDHQRHTTMDFGWPTRMQEAGVALSEMYRSNKWKLDRKEWEEYKHIAEGKQHVLVEPGFLREHASPSKRVDVYGQMVELEEPMPQHFAQLAPFLGAQIQLYGEDGKIHGDEDIYQVEIAHAYWGGTKHPVTKEPFLFVFSKSDGVHMIVTGDKLDIEKDGIVG